MKPTIHIATTYRVEYAPGENIAAEPSDLNHVLWLLCPGLCSSSDRLADATTITLPKDEARAAIHELSEHARQWTVELGVFGIRRKELIGLLRRCLSAADPAGDQIVLSWF